MKNGIFLLIFTSLTLSAQPGKYSELKKAIGLLKTQVSSEEFEQLSFIRAARTLQDKCLKLNQDEAKSKELGFRIRYKAQEASPDDSSPAPQSVAVTSTHSDGNIDDGRSLNLDSRHSRFASAEQDLDQSSLTLRANYQSLVKALPRFFRRFEKSLNSFGQSLATPQDHAELLALAAQLDLAKFAENAKAANQTMKAHTKTGNHQDCAKFATELIGPIPGGAK